VLVAVAAIWEGGKALFAIPRYKLPHLYEILADFFRQGAGGERWFTIMAQNAGVTALESGTAPAGAPAGSGSGRGGQRLPSGSWTPT